VNDLCDTAFASVYLVSEGLEHFHVKYTQVTPINVKGEVKLIPPCAELCALIDKYLNDFF
jgi:hypothetical protein